LKRGTSTKIRLLGEIVGILFGGIVSWILGGFSSQTVASNAAADLPPALHRLWEGQWNWNISPPLVSPANRLKDPCYGIKDPTIVRFNGRWHLFCTIRSQKRTHQIEYLSFAAWKEANAAERYVMRMTDGYFCAPQVFYFTAHEKWYLIYQIKDKSRKPELQPAFSTTTSLVDPDSWSKPKLMFSKQPQNVTIWVDFWVICDSSRAHLFFSSNDGQMWRAETKLSDFPNGWSEPKIVLRGDIYEASHTYHLKGYNKYLTLIEARFRDRRYYKAYLADYLDGEWQPLAATKEKPFASWVNCSDSGPHWTDSFSHGELLREGFDQAMEVEPGHLEFLFQGVSDQEQEGKSYGQIPWRLGLLTPVTLP
jgi:hypothetical protein